VIEFVVVETAIRQLHAHYADAVWRKDLQAFGDCFTEDAEWRIGGRILRGREDIVENLRRLLPNYHRILMTFRTPIIELGQGTASGRTYVTENNVFTDGRPGCTVGTYFEHFVEQSDRWRFSWRLFQTHYLGPADISGPMFENPDFGPPPRMPPRDAPTYDHTGLTSRAWNTEGKPEGSG